MSGKGFFYAFLLEKKLPGNFMRLKKKIKKFVFKNNLVRPIERS